MRTVTALLAAVLLLAPVATAFADSSPAANLTVDVNVAFTAEEIRIIRAHYDGSGGKKSRGKPGFKGLPPGIAKNLARGKPLPPGIAKQALPDELRHALPPVRDGYERIIVDGRILLVEIATRVIHDVLADVILN